jgi:hypothetical protein
MQLFNCANLFYFFSEILMSIGFIPAMGTYSERKIGLELTTLKQVVTDLKRRLNKPTPHT